MWNGGTAPHILHRHTCLKYLIVVTVRPLPAAQITSGTRANLNAAEENSIKASTGNRKHVPWSCPTGYNAVGMGLVMCTESSKFL